MGNHPDNQRVSDANQWPHHFNMLGQLLLGFIFMIVVFFLYVVRPSRPALVSSSPRVKARPSRHHFCSSFFSSSFSSSLTSSPS